MERTQDNPPVCRSIFVSGSSTTSAAFTPKSVELINTLEKDNANKKASKELASYLSDSHFHELLKAGHEANIESPEELAAVLQEFYDNIESI